MFRATRVARQAERLVNRNPVDTCSFLNRMVTAYFTPTKSIQGKILMFMTTLETTSSKTF